MVDPFGRVNLAGDVSAHDYVIKVILGVHTFPLLEVRDLDQEAILLCSTLLKLLVNLLLQWEGLLELGLFFDLLVTWLFLLGFGVGSECDFVLKFKHLESGAFERFILFDG